MDEYGYEEEEECFEDHAEEILAQITNLRQDFMRDRKMHDERDEIIDQAMKTMALQMEQIAVEVCTLKQECKFVNSQSVEQVSALCSGKDIVRIMIRQNHQHTLMMTRIRKKLIKS